MATVNGVTAEKVQTVLDQTIVSATIVGSTLQFTRTDGSVFSAGDFATYINSQISAPLNAGLAANTASITAQIAAQVPPAVAGGLSSMGNMSGVFSFSGLTSAQMVNRMFVARLIGNVSVNLADFPASPVPGTQFAIRFQQDATGGRTLTLLGGIKVSQGVLALSTFPNAIDIIVFIYDGTWWYAGAMGVGFL